MYFILVFLLVICLSIFDGSASSAVLMSFILLGGMLSCLTLPLKKRKDGFRLFTITYCVYILVAFVASLSFSANQFFYVSDSMRYISEYIGRTTFYYSADDFYRCYFEFSDSNLLYNAYLNVISLLMNKHYGGMSVYGMTLCQTLFGVLSTMVMYRIFLRHFDDKFAFRQVLLFSLFSPFLIYSSLIVRDIVICFLFLLAFDVVDRKFSILGLIKLVIIMLLAWGIRLYSGLFVSVFIWYYIQIYFRKSSLKSFGTVLSVSLGAIALVAIVSSSLMEQTSEELAVYEELSSERSAGGVLSRLMNLPPGIRHLAIVLFAMIRPLPPFIVYAKVESFSNFAIATMALVSGFFWFVIFYAHAALLAFKNQLKRMKYEEVLLLGICFLFLLGNAAHPDVRRMTPVFPALYMFFSLSMIEPQNSNSVKKYKQSLVSFYIVMAFALLVMV